MHRLLLSLAALAGLAACNTSSTPDPKAPANEPAVIDTRPPAPAVAGAAPVKLIPDDYMDRRIPIDQAYSLAGFTMRNGDIAMLASLYHPNASLKTPDTTVTGNQSIAEQWNRFARGKSIADFQRTPRSLTVADDSTLIDSGSYVIKTARAVGDTISEKGSFVTRWRIRKEAAKWVMLEDQIAAGKVEKKKGGK
ncbi:MAG: nuclear transport factor 2 family protein [Gemmatimonadota bacterium]|nr:nuclear transport factor 2 family protein [Gemmatimonadota bacterium]